ncbi:MAG TPA: D-arabinono-1,4-lactone oxidase [Candidatus Limnocylindrales bacterium]|nr:D-arabinono-1,4-lactone oxidase [Candidatus Limnocylindrales bacterium]
MDRDASTARRRTNWSGDITYEARRLLAPRSVEEAQAMVREARRLRPLGSGHTFNRIADTDGDQITLVDLPRRTHFDPTAMSVTVDGGQRYGDLCGPLDKAGFALHNLASLAHISIAGACATGTHGSGQRNGMLATAIERVELIGGDGALRTFSREDERFPGVATSLGALGVVTALTLRVEPTFDVAQYVDEDLPIDDALADLDDILGSAYSVSLFLEWDRLVIDQVWRKVRVGRDDEARPRALARARPADRERHPIRAVSPENSTPQRGIPGAWHERLPHFRLDHTPSVGEEFQSEYFVARADGAAALEALLAIRDRMRPAILVSEVRSIAGDDLWLSPAYQRDSVAFHFTWSQLPDEVDEALAAIERALEPFDPRPHWGKRFVMAPDQLRARYAELPRFVELAGSLDPDGVFRNRFLDRYVFGSD